MAFEIGSATRRVEDLRFTRGRGRYVDDISVPGDAYGRGTTKKRLHHNVLAIALANKLARIAWSVLARGRVFEVRKMDAAATQSACSIF